MVQPACPNDVLQQTHCRRYVLGVKRILQVVVTPYLRQQPVVVIAHVCQKAEIAINVWLKWELDHACPVCAPQHVCQPCSVWADNDLRILEEIKLPLYALEGIW